MKLILSLVTCLFTTLLVNGQHKIDSVRIHALPLDAFVRYGYHEGDVIKATNPIILKSKKAKKCFEKLLIEMEELKQNPVNDSGDIDLRIVCIINQRNTTDTLGLNYSNHVIINGKKYIGSRKILKILNHYIKDKSVKKSIKRAMRNS